MGMSEINEKLAELREGMARAAAILDSIVITMQEVGAGPNSETAILGVMDYLDRMSDDMDAVNCALRNQNQKTAYYIIISPKKVAINRLCTGFFNAYVRL